MNSTTKLKRQLRRTEHARQLWRQRNADKQRAIRKLRVALRDVTASRDLWKQRCQSASQQTQADPTSALLALPVPSTPSLPESRLGGA